VPLARQVEDAAAVGASIHEVAQEHQPVLALQVKAVEELGELKVAAVDVPDGDEAAVHEVRVIPLEIASVGAGVK